MFWALLFAKWSLIFDRLSVVATSTLSSSPSSGTLSILMRPPSSTEHSKFMKSAMFTKWTVRVRVLRRLGVQLKELVGAA